VAADRDRDRHRDRRFHGAPRTHLLRHEPHPRDAQELRRRRRKVVKYEIFGNGSYADINYLDLNSKPVRVDGATLPWSLTLSTTAPSVLPNIVAQGDGNSVSCRITVDNEVKDQKTTDGVNAQTFCLVKNA
jgi:hypothetical protein